jgi:hypothetical protein
MPEPGRTTFLALALLHDAIHRADATALKPQEPGVRLALAYLWSITLTKNREPFDEMWKTLVKGEPYIRDRFRSTMANTLFARICREIQVEQTVELGTALAKARAGMTRPGNDVG